MDALHQEAHTIHESKQKLRDKIESLEVELAKAASESEIRPTQPEDKPSWKNFAQMAMETATSAEEFLRMCWQGAGIPMPAGNVYMAVSPLLHEGAPAYVIICSRLPQR